MLWRSFYFVIKIEKLKNSHSAKSAQAKYFFFLSFLTFYFKTCLSLVLLTDKPCVSGLHDCDYPSFLNSGLGMDIFTEIGDIRKVPLPAELVEHFGRILYYNNAKI